MEKRRVFVNLCIRVNTDKKQCLRNENEEKLGLLRSIRPWLWENCPARALVDAAIEEREIEAGPLGVRLTRTRR